MAKCPHCGAGFHQPTLTRLKATGFWQILNHYMATCPSCQNVLSVYGA